MRCPRRVVFTVVLTLLTACSLVHPQRPSLDPAIAKMVSNTADEIVNAVWLDRTPLQHVKTAAAPTGAEAANMPEIRSAAISVHTLTRGLRFRATVLMRLLDAGALGVAHDGTLVTRSGLPPKYDAGEILSLLNSDNEDRRSLADKLAQLNGLPPSSKGAVTEVLSRAWRTGAKPGWWVEQSPGEWARR